MAPYDSNYKMKPPLRACCDRDAIIEGIVSGAIGTIATDHAPHPGSEKMQEFESCPFGIIGLETAIALTIEELVHPGKITLSRMVELFTTGPESVDRASGAGRWRRTLRGDVTIFAPGRRLDLRCESIILAQPQLPVPRAHLPRRRDGHDCEWGVLYGGAIAELSLFHRRPRIATIATTKAQQRAMRYRLRAGPFIIMVTWYA